MKPTILTFLLIASLSVSAQDKMLDKYDNIFSEATINEKNVILVFGHKHCGWCRVFDSYHASPEVKVILETEYIIHKIDIIESKIGRALFDHYRLQGTPAWMIFSFDKKLLANGKDSNGKNVGYPYKQSEMANYLSSIQKSSKKINENELQVLSAKLKDLADHKINKMKNGS